MKKLAVQEELFNFLNGVGLSSFLHSISLFV